MARSTGPRSVKKKATARQNAQQRSQRQSKRADVPRLQSDKQVSQSRFPGETPLTGEDRPSGRAGHKQRGFRQDTQQPRSRVKRDTTSSPRAPATKRRPTRQRGAGEPNERG
jgi:hypothetical protein